MKYKFIKEVYVEDPDTNAPIHIEIWKDTDSGGIFGMDSSFLEQVDEFYNPFNGKCEGVDIYLPDPPDKRPLMDGF